MNFSEDHLRITKVRTADGLTPIYDPVSKQPLTKIVTAPLTKAAKAAFEDQNTRLPTHLKMKIEEVPGYVVHPSQQQSVDVDALHKKIAELEAEKQKLLAQQKPDTNNVSAENISTKEQGKPEDKQKTFVK